MERTLAWKFESHPQPTRTPNCTGPVSSTNRGSKRPVRRCRVSPRAQRTVSRELAEAYSHLLRIWSGETTRKGSRCRAGEVQKDVAATPSPGHTSFPQIVPRSASASAASLALSRGAFHTLPRPTCSRSRPPVAPPEPCRLRARKPESSLPGLRDFSPAAPEGPRAHRPAESFRLHRSRSCPIRASAQLPNPRLHGAHPPRAAPPVRPTLQAPEVLTICQTR